MFVNFVQTRCICTQVCVGSCGYTFQPCFRATVQSRDLQAWRFAKLAKILPCLKIFRLLSDFSMFADWHYLFSKINRIMETIFVGTKISLDFSIMYFVPLIIYGVDLTISFVVDKLDSFFFKWQRVLEKKRNMNHNIY